MTATLDASPADVSAQPVRVKLPLSRERYIDVALQLIQEEREVAKLSLRKVAVRLGSSAMAMYKHFPSKEALLDAVLEAFIARANTLPEPDLPWQDWVREFAYGMYRIFRQDASWVAMMGNLHLGETALGVTQTFIDTLMRQGFTREQASNAYMAVVQLILGAVCVSESAKDIAQNNPLAAQFPVPVMQCPLDASLPFLLQALELQRSEKLADAGALNAP